MPSQRLTRILTSSILLGSAFLATDMSDVRPAFAAACAPTSATVGTDVVVKFTNVGTCEWTVPSGVTQARALVVGGGGGGGFDIGGGGGAGGVRTISSLQFSAGETLTVIVGAGGAGDVQQGLPCVGANGGTSSIAVTAGTFTAIGGGGGGGQDGGGACSTDGVSGASGGGGGVGLQWPMVGGSGTYASDSDATTFGNNGGNTPLTGGYYAGGGGGGAGAVGGNGSSDGSGSIGGAGGIGYSSDITGVATLYAGGGAGGFFQNGTRGFGGTGGGGDGGTNAVAPTGGTNGLGGGGGGGGVQNGVYGQGAAGGSGVVILRYSTIAPTTTTIATTTTTAVPTTTTTTVPRLPQPTAAPALEIIVEAPSTSAVGQASVATIGSTVAVLSSSQSKPATPITKSAVTTAPPTMTTTLAPRPVEAEPQPPARVVVVDPGEAGVQVGDKKSEATVERQNNQLVISVGTMRATIGSFNADGSVSELDADGNVVLRGGDTVRVKLSGFEPGSQFEAWLFSTPYLLGTTTVGPVGNVVGNYTIPEKVSVGNHRIVLVSKSADNETTTLAVGIMIGSWESDTNITIWLIVLPIAFAMIGALVLPATRRRRQRAVV